MVSVGDTMAYQHQAQIRTAHSWSSEWVESAGAQMAGCINMHPASPAVTTQRMGVLVGGRHTRRSGVPPSDKHANSLRARSYQPAAPQWSTPVSLSVGCPQSRQKLSQPWAPHMSAIHVSGTGPNVCPWDYLVVNNSDLFFVPGIF